MKLNGRGTGSSARDVVARCPDGPDRSEAADVVTAERYSIVIPIFNEEETIPALAARLTPVIDAFDGPTEVVLVDDGRLRPVVGAFDGAARARQALQSAQFVA